MDEYDVIYLDEDERNARLMRMRPIGDRQRLLARRFACFAASGGSARSRRLAGSQPGDQQPSTRKT